MPEQNTTNIPYSISFSGRARRPRIVVHPDMRVVLVLPVGFSEEEGGKFVHK